jgi:hypothetical protein
VGIFSSVTDTFTTETLASSLRFHLILQRGKRAWGEGFNSLGDLLPGLMRELDCETFARTCPTVPRPCTHPSTVPTNGRRWRSSATGTCGGHWVWDEATTRRYFLAGGGDASEFEGLWQQAGRQMAAELAAMEAGHYHCGNGTVTISVSGRKA